MPWHWRQRGAKRWRTSPGPARDQQGPTRDREGPTTKPAPSTIPTGSQLGHFHSENITSDLPAGCKIAAITFWGIAAIVNLTYLNRMPLDIGLHVKVKGFHS